MPLHRISFYLTILLLPTQVGKHFFPDWALVLGRRLDYLSPTLFLTDITIILTLFFWLIQKNQNSKFRIQNSKINPKTLFISLSLCLFIVVNILLAASPLIALYKWLKVLEFVLFGFYIVKTRPSFSRTMWCLSIAVLYSSIIAISQFILQHSVGGFLWFLGERTFDVATPGIATIQILPISIFPALSADRNFPFSIFHSRELLRPYATFPHPNVLGGFLAVLLPLIIGSSNFSLSFLRPPASAMLKALRAGKQEFRQLFSGSLVKSGMTRKLIKLFRISTIILGCLALILTFSRSAWIVGIIGFLISLFIVKRKQILEYWYFWILVIIGLFIASLPYFQTLTPNSESVFVRNELTNAALSIWKTSPLIGVGLGNFLVELPKYYPHRDIFFLQPVHNVYLLILSETGIIGFTSFLLFIASVFWNKEYGTGKKGKKQKYHASIIPYSLFLILVLGAVDHYPLTLQQGQLLLTILMAFSLLHR